MPLAIGATLPSAQERHRSACWVTIVYHAACQGMPRLTVPFAFELCRRDSTRAQIDTLEAETSGMKSAKPLAPMPDLERSDAFRAKGLLFARWACEGTAWRRLGVVYAIDVAARRIPCSFFIRAQAWRVRGARR